MLKAHGEAPSYRELRPLEPRDGDAETATRTDARFPVYKDLVERLLRPRDPKNPYDPTAAHVCAVAAGWAYADHGTVATMLARLGLAENRYTNASVYNDAMFIASNAYVVQSKCGRVAILCYRGTEPRNFINWLTDADVNPIKLPFRTGSKHDPRIEVHGGFYRNVRATWYEVVTALDRAVRGLPVYEPPKGKSEKLPYGLEALYVTGHSLGAAMAALAAVRLATDGMYVAFRAKLRGVYTFGQPMIGNQALVDACAEHDLLTKRFFRHVYGNDVVPRLPPVVTGKFVHFGEEYRAHQGTPWVASKSSKQVSDILWSTLLVPAVAFLAKQLERSRNLDFEYSWYDHSPTHYIDASTPPDVESEFERMTPEEAKTRAAWSPASLWSRAGMLAAAAATQLWDTVGDTGRVLLDGARWAGNGRRAAPMAPFAAVKTGTDDTR